MHEPNSYLQQSLKKRNLDMGQRDSNIRKGFNLDVKRTKEKYIEKLLQIKERERSQELYDKYDIENRMYLGKIEYADGSEYKGQYVVKKQEKERHGLGIYRFSNNDIYMGYWCYNEIETSTDNAVYLYENSEAYVGRLGRDNKKHQVTGTYFYMNKDIYKGEWVNNQKDG